MSIVIGLTGPTGSGKSSAAKLCEKHGIKRVDCDKIARKATETGSEGLKALSKIFGADILNNDGSLNRKVLANKAFSTKENTELLNRTIFPFIKELVLNEIDSDKVLLDAPTLFESGINSICFKTVAVLSDTEIRLKRIIGRDNLTEKEAKLRMSAGKSDNFYKENADYIIYNNSDEQTFLNEFEKVLAEIFE